MSCLSSRPKPWNPVLRPAVQFTTSNILFFPLWLIRIYGLVAKVSCRDSGDLGLIPAGCWNSLHFFLGFRQRISHADRVVNLNTTIWLPQFWRTWTRPALAHMCWPGTWAEIIKIVELWSWLTTRSVASFVPDFSKIQKKRRPSKRLSKVHALHCRGKH